MLRVRHWQDPVSALLGAWLTLSPWTLGFAEERILTVHFVLTGVLLMATAVGAIVVPKAWEAWLEVALGVWLIASPWALGFNGNFMPMQNALFCGLLVTILALWVLGSDEEYSAWWHRLVG